MDEWLVAADDRTGALEVAAELAVAGRPVVVSVYPRVPEHGVVDLGSRALDGCEAAHRAASVDASARAWTAHKIDSTLRGNWAVELRARAAVLERPVLIVPAWPLMDRTCRGGVVHVGGRAVAAVSDAVVDVVLLGGAPDVGRWNPGEREWAVVDVASTEELRAVAVVAARRDWLVAGPAGAVGAVYSARSGESAGTSRPPRGAGRVVLACASATVVSAEQLRRVSVARPEVDLIVAPPPGDGPLRIDAARDVGEQVHERLRERDVGTLIVVGGDTAAVVLGDGDRLVGGYAAPGMPWSLGPSGVGPLVITKAGGFGGPDALVDLLAAL